ncbi:MAG: protein MnhE [Desulfuromonas sp.]|nr:MAG: protein MnhE [Desulfuromonas sp.]
MKAKLVTFVILLIFWIIMSGMFDGFHLTLGVLCCLLVAFFSNHLLFTEAHPPSLRGCLGFVVYLPYLFWQIIIANIQVAFIVLHPRMLDKIDPHLFRFDTVLKRPLSKVALAQSITLTPGTITVDVHDEQFTVYALTKDAADALPGEMEQRVARALER